MNITLNDIRDDIMRSVQQALQEDIGGGDITALLIPEDKTDTAEIITREDCVVCGIEWVNETFKQLGGLDFIEWHVHEGNQVKANTKLASFRGNTRTLLTGERTALNFLQLLSGTATKAHEYRQLAGGSIQILDTRKTIPGLRLAQKYAVAVGGCVNHRIGLYDAFLIKENHIAACGGISAAILKARELRPGIEVEIEVENAEELEEALEAGADIIMLDNFDDGDLNALQKLDKKQSRFEVSGNVTQARIGRLAEEAVVDRISIGDLTKNLRAVDLSMRIK